jgi:putative PIN family toxin of toxin-antitoxin system
MDCQTVVIDTNIFVSACLGGGSANRVLRACVSGRCKPLMGAALLAEYEDVLQRESLWRGSALTAAERTELLDVFLGVCRWTRVYFTWRPNLPDEADNHLIELAVAGNAAFIVTRNLRDLTRGELQFPGLRAVGPADFEKELSSWPH